MFKWIKNTFSTKPVATSRLRSAKLDVDYIHQVSPRASTEFKLQGDKFLQSNLLQEAEESYLNAISNNPDNEDALISIGTLYIQQGLHDQAEKYLNNALLSNKNNALIIYNLGLIKLRRNQYKQAITNFNQSLELIPEAEVVFRDLCYAQFKLGKIEEAKASIQKGLTLNPNFAGYYFFRGNIQLHEQDIDSAIHSYRQALGIQSDFIQAKSALANCLFMQGNTEESLSYFGEVHNIKLANANSFQQLGFLLQAHGNNKAASYCYRKAISLKPELAEAHLNLGNLLKQEGMIQEAIASYQNAIAYQEVFPAAYFNLAITLNKLGQQDEAKLLLQKAIKYQPNFAEAYFSLATIYLAEGNPEHAKLNFEKVAIFKPDFPNLHYQLALTCLGLNLWDEAIRNFKADISLNPENPDSYLSLGNIFKMQGQINESLNHFEKAIEINPDFAGAYSNIGVLKQEQGHYAEAIQYYQKAISLRPDLVDTQCNLGLVLVEQGQRYEAISYFKKALQLQSDFYPAQINLINQWQHLCEWNEWEAHITALRQAVLNKISWYNARITPFVFLGLPDTTALEQKKCAEKFASMEFQYLQPLRKKLLPSHPIKLDSKISIAYLSADFKQHPVSFLMAEIFERHDRNKFHISAYSYGPDDASQFRKRLEMSFDRFVDIQDKSFLESANIIRNDQVDILIDLTGYTADSRSAILALRPAPIQVNYLGYTSTMGADFVDYLIADEFVIPRSEDSNFTEHIERLPGCYMPSDTTRVRLDAPTRAEVGLPEKAFVFCCFNQPYKITPELFSIWARLLNVIPESVLWLPASNPLTQQNIKLEASKRGVHENRILFSPKMDKIEDHLARLQCADLFLDTLPFNAHTTCNDALWMGLPVLTCVGNTFTSRVAGSQLNTLEMPELITENLTDYYERALMLATKPEYYAEIRTKLYKKINTSSLFNSELFTQNIENAYSRMIEQYICNQKNKSQTENNRI